MREEHEQRLITLVRTREQPWLGAIAGCVAAQDIARLDALTSLANPDYAVLAAGARDDGIEDEFSEFIETPVGRAARGVTALARSVLEPRETGSVLALLGPNGAGKTTTVEILQGLRRRDGGSVTVLGHDPQRSSRAWKARIGVVSQTSADFKDLTVTEAVSHVARFFAQPADVAATIGRVGLADDARTRASRLSGGRRRRLDVALAIVGRPELLFLDEPTTGFDPRARRVFWKLVEDMSSLQITSTSPAPALYASSVKERTKSFASIFALIITI